MCLLLTVAVVEDMLCSLEQSTSAGLCDPMDSEWDVVANQRSSGVTILSAVEMDTFLLSSTLQASLAPW